MAAAMRASAPDQVGTLMAFLGLVGALVSLFALYAAVDGFWSWSQLLSVCTLIVASLLCVRSLAHAWVGFRLAGRDPGSSDPLAVSGQHGADRDAGRRRHDPETPLRPDRPGLSVRRAR